MRVFAAGSATNDLRLEVTWRTGWRSVIEAVRANRIYWVDESAASQVNPEKASTKPPPLFVEATALIRHSHHETPFDDFERQPLLPCRLSQMGPGIAWCDLNGDGHDDLIIVGGRGGALAVFRSDGRGGFTPLEPRLFRPRARAPRPSERTAARGRGVRAPSRYWNLLADLAARNNLTISSFFNCQLVMDLISFWKSMRLRTTMIVRRNFSPKEMSAAATVQNGVQIMRKTTNKILAFTCLLTGLAASQAVAQTLNNPIHIGRNGSGTSVAYNGATAEGESYTIVGGGADMWDRVDEFTFTYHELAGDFDIKCQVTYLQPTAQFSKAGIVAKESLAEDSRRVAQTVSPAAVPADNGATGNNSMEMVWRTGNWNVSGDNGGNNNASVAAPQYPNAWIRLVREGARFRGYVGTDGVTWQQTAEQDTATWNGGAMSGKILVGLGVSRHPSADDNGGVNRRCRAEFTNYVETIQNFVVGEAMSKSTNEVFVTFSRPVKQDAAALIMENYVLTGGPNSGGAFTTGVRPGPTPNVMIVTTEDLVEGPVPYVLTVSGLVDTDDVPLAGTGTTQSFIHPGKVGEFALNRIHIRRNQFEGQDPGFLEASTAYAQGIPTSVYNRPLYDTNTIFEDTMIPTGDQPAGVDRYSTRIVGVLNVPTDGNYGFGIANDDHANLYLSPNDQLASKTRIHRRDCCNGARNYPDGGLSPLQALVAGPHLLEYIYAEGGGGNYGAVAWDAGTGAAITSGQTPIPEDAFIPSRFAYNTVFYSLGAPQILTQPASVTVLVGATASFSVVMDGTPPYQFTWSTNGVPVAGASGSTLTFSDIQGSQNATTVSVCVTNGLGGVCSSTATLTVLLNPNLASASSQGNCHAIYLNFNRLMTLDGTYTVVCSNNVSGAAFYTENFDATDGGYTVTNLFPYDGPWVYAAGSWTEAGQTTDNAQQNTSYLNSPPITLTAGGPVQMSFAHRHSFEQGGGFWDAGQVRLSVNGGPFTTVPGSAFTSNGYTGTISANNNNTLQNQDGFAGNSAGYATTTITSICTLGSFAAGDIIQVQFIAANDANTRGEFQPGWEISSVELSALVPNLTPLTVTGPTYGSSQQQIRLGVAPDLAEGNVYYVTVTGATSQGDGLLVDPNPSTIAVVHGAAYPAFQIVYKRYNGAGGVLLSDLYNMPKYPASPDVVSTDRFVFEVPVDVADNYGATLAGWYRAPQAGTYRFWMSADDQGATFLATDAIPGHAVQINIEPASNGSRQFAVVANGRTADANGYPSQTQSAPIALTAGQVVYLEGRLKEGGGGDNYSCAVTIDNPVPPANGSVPIAAADFVPRRLAPSGFIFDTLCNVLLRQPIGDKTGYPSLAVTFAADVDGTPILAGSASKGYYYQWSLNSVAIAGATNASYTTLPLAMVNSGDVYSVVASNDFSSVSGSATLTVEERPVVVSASTKNHPSNIYLQFNIPVVLNLANYLLTNSADLFALDIASIAYGSSHSEVVLTAASPIPINSTCGLRVSGVVAENGGGTLVTDPTYLLFPQGPGSFCPDLTLGLPAGAALYGTALPILNTTDGTVQLTVEANDQGGGLVWGDNNASSIVLDASFDLAMYKTLDADPADGFSFNIAQDLPQDNTIRAYEDGAGSGLRVCFRNYGGNNPGYRIVYNGVTVAYVNRGNRVMCTVLSATPPFKNVRLQISATGLLSLSWGSDAPFTNLQLPNYTGLKGKFGMYARNGGLNHISIVRNICVNNYTLGDAAVTLAQTTSTPAECATVTFTATATGSQPLYYQWLRNGTPIGGAIGSSYTTPAVICPADQGVVYSVRVTNLFSTITGAGTALAVTCDDVPPTLVAVGSVNGSKINALFSEAVDAATALDPAKYSLNGQPAGIEISNIVFLPIQAGRAITLNLSNSLTGAFTLGASGVLDACPARNATTSSTNGTVVNTELLSADVGTLNDPRPPGTNYSFAAGQIDITVGGSDFWGNSDHAHFVYTPRTGDFDVKTKVTRLDLQSSWSKAGLDARIDLTTGSPSISTYADPTNGANQVETRLRDTPNGGINDLNATLGVPRPSSMQTPWLRMQRAGDRIVTSVSSNGVNWQVNIDTGALLCGAMPPTMLVGVMTTPNNGNNGNTTTSQLDSFSLTPPGTYPIDGSRVSVTYSAGSVVIGAASSSCGQVLTLRLQGTIELKSDPALTVWTDLGPAPVTLPADGAMRYFRAVFGP